MKLRNEKEALLTGPIRRTFMLISAAGIICVMLIISLILGSSRAGSESYSNMMYCADEAKPNVPKCPPPAGSLVYGIWDNGTSATVEWTGARWAIDVPGGRRVTVSPPHNWIERE